MHGRNTSGNANGGLSNNFPRHGQTDQSSNGPYNFLSPDSPPDAMDLIHPGNNQFQIRHSPFQTIDPIQQEKSELRMVRPTSNKTAIPSTSVILSKRQDVECPSSMPFSPGSNGGQQLITTPNSSHSSGGTTSRVETGELSSPGKKLTPQELNRLRINQASEFYRRQRELMSTQNRSSTSLDSPDDLTGVNVVSPLARDQQLVEKSGMRSFRMPNSTGDVRQGVSDQKPSQASALRASRIVRKNPTTPTEMLVDPQSGFQTSDFAGNSSLGLDAMEMAHADFDPLTLLINSSVEPASVAGLQSQMNTGHLITTPGSSVVQLVTLGQAVSHQQIAPPIIGKPSPVVLPKRLPESQISDSNLNISTEEGLKSREIARPFMQHWVDFQEGLSTLILEFQRSFLLLIPFVPRGKGYNSKFAQVFPVTRTSSSGEKLEHIVFKIVDTSEVHDAIVLNDVKDLFRLLKSRKPCVVRQTLDDILRLSDPLLNISSGTVGQQVPEVQVPAPVVPGSVVQVSSVDFMDCLPSLQSDSSAFITEMPKLPAGTVIVPQDSQILSQIFGDDQFLLSSNIFSNDNQYLTNQSESGFPVDQTFLPDGSCQFTMATQSQNEVVGITSNAEGSGGNSFLVQHQPINSIMQHSPLNQQPVTHHSSSIMSPGMMQQLSPMAQGGNVPRVSPLPQVSTLQQSPMSQMSPMAQIQPQQQSPLSTMQQFSPMSMPPIQQHPSPISQLQQVSPISKQVTLQQPSKIDLMHQSSPLVQIASPVRQIIQQPKTQKQIEVAATASSSQSKYSEFEQGPLVFPESINVQLYPSINVDDLEHVRVCRYCRRKFTFNSELLAHMRVHTENVSAEMERITRWSTDRKFKCHFCQRKFCYTLEYAKHLDTHGIKGLGCRICQCYTATPSLYGEHMAIHHPSIIQSTGAGNQQPQATQQSQSSQQYQDAENPFNQQVTKVQPQFEQQIQKPQPFGHHGQIQDIFGSPDQLPELSQPMSKEHEEVIQDLLDSIPHGDSTALSHVDDWDYILKDRPDPEPPQSQTLITNDMPILDGSSQVMNHERYLQELAHSVVFEPIPSKSSSQDSSSKMENEETTESIDESVRSLAQNLAGSIDDQPFGYDKEESLNFEFGAPVQGPKETQHLQTFENCLSGTPSHTLQRSENEQTLRSPLSNFEPSSFNMTSVAQGNFLGDILQPLCGNVQLTASQPPVVFNPESKAPNIMNMNSLSPSDHNLGNDLFLSDDDDDGNDPLFKNDLTVSSNFNQSSRTESLIEIFKELEKVPYGNTNPPAQLYTSQDSQQIISPVTSEHLQKSSGMELPVPEKMTPVFGAQALTLEKQTFSPRPNCPLNTLARASVHTKSPRSYNFTGHTPTKFNCQLCMSAFESRDSLQGHIMICQKRSRTPIGLLPNKSPLIMSPHTRPVDDIEQSTSCNICGSGFRTVASLKIHVALCRKHRGIQKVSQVKPVGFPPSSIATLQKVTKPSGLVYSNPASNSVDNFGPKNSRNSATFKIYKSRPTLKEEKSHQKHVTKDLPIPPVNTYVRGESKMVEGPIKLVLNMKDVWSKQGKDPPLAQIPVALPRKRGRPRRTVVEPVLPRVQQGLLVVRKDPEEPIPKPDLPRLTIRETVQEDHYLSVKKKKKKEKKKKEKKQKKEEKNTMDRFEQSIYGSGETPRIPKLLIRLNPPINGLNNSNIDDSGKTNNRFSRKSNSSCSRESSPRSSSDRTPASPTTPLIVKFNELPVIPRTDEDLSPDLQSVGPDLKSPAYTERKLKIRVKTPPPPPIRPSLNDLLLRLKDNCEQEKLPKSCEVENVANLEDLIEKDPLVQDFENCKRVVENATLNEALSILVRRQNSRDSDDIELTPPSQNIVQNVNPLEELAPPTPPIKLKISLGHGQERVTVIKRQSENEIGAISAENNDSCHPETKISLSISKISEKMDWKNRHKFKRHFKSKDPQKVGCLKNFPPKITDDDRKVPPLKIKPLFMKPEEKKSFESPALDTTGSKAKETSSISKDIIDTIQSKALSVAVQRMEPHIVEKYMNKVTKAVTKSTPAEESEINLKRSSDGQVSQTNAQPVGKLVLKIRTEKKPLAEKAVIWKPLSRDPVEQISLTTEKVTKPPISDEKASEPPIPNAKAEEHVKPTQAKVMYEPRKFVMPPLEPPMIVKNPPFFARKSAPKPIEHSDSKTVNQKAKLIFNNEEKRSGEKRVEGGPTSYTSFSAKSPDLDLFKSTHNAPCKNDVFKPFTHIEVSWKSKTEDERHLSKEAVEQAVQHNNASRISNENNESNETDLLKNLNEVQSLGKMFDTDVITEIPTVEKVVDKVSKVEIEEKDGDATKQGVTKNEDHNESIIILQISGANVENVLPILGNNQFDLETKEEASGIRQSQMNAKTSKPDTELNDEIQGCSLSVGHHVESIKGESKPVDEKSGLKILGQIVKPDEQLPIETLLAQHQEHPKPDDDDLNEMEFQPSVTKVQTEKENKNVEQSVETAKTTDQCKVESTISVQDPTSATKPVIEKMETDSSPTEGSSKEEINSKAKTEESKFDLLKETMVQPNLHQSANVIEATHTESSDTISDVSNHLTTSDAHVRRIELKVEEKYKPNSFNQISSPVESQMQDTIGQISSSLELDVPISSQPIGEIEEKLRMEKSVEPKQKLEVKPPEMTTSSAETDGLKLTTLVHPQLSHEEEITQVIDCNLLSDTRISDQIPKDENQKPPSPGSDGATHAEEKESKPEISKEAQFPALADMRKEEGSFKNEVLLHGTNYSESSENRLEPETFKSDDGPKGNDEKQVIDQKTSEQEGTVKSEHSVDVSAPQAQIEKDMVDANNLISAQREEFSEVQIMNSNRTSEDSCKETNENLAVNISTDFIANPEIIDVKSKEEKKLEPSYEEDALEVAVENETSQETDLIEEQELEVFVLQSCSNESFEHERLDHQPFVDEFVDIDDQQQQQQEISPMDLEEDAAEEYEVERSSSPGNSENDSSSVPALQEIPNEEANANALIERTNFSSSQNETPEQKEYIAEEVNQKSEEPIALESQSCICLPPDSPQEESSSGQEAVLKAETPEPEGIDDSDDKILNTPDIIEEPELGLPDSFHKDIDLPMELVSIDDELDLGVIEDLESVGSEVEVNNQGSLEDVMEPNQSGESVEILNLEVGYEIEANTIESQSESKSIINQVQDIALESSEVIPRQSNSEPTASNDAATKEAEIQTPEEDDIETAQENIDKTIPKIVDPEVPIIDLDEAMVTDLDPPLDVSETNQSESSVQDLPEDSQNQQGNFQHPSPGKLVENHEDVLTVEAIVTNQSELEDVIEDSQNVEPSVDFLKSQEDTTKLQEPEVSIEEDPSDIQTSELSVVSSKQEVETVDIKSHEDTSVNSPDEEESQLVDADSTPIESLTTESCLSGNQVMDQVEVAREDLSGEPVRIESENAEETLSSSPSNLVSAPTVIEDSNITQNEKSNETENFEDCDPENSKSAIIDEDLTMGSEMLDPENNSTSSLNSLDSVEIPTDRPLQLVEDEENSDCLGIENDQAKSDASDYQHVKNPEESTCDIEEGLQTPPLIDADGNQKDSQFTDAPMATLPTDENSDSSQNETVCPLEDKDQADCDEGLDETFAQDNDAKGLQVSESIATSEEITDDEEKQQNQQSVPEKIDTEKVTSDTILKSDDLGDVETNNEESEASEGWEKMQEIDDADEVREESLVVDLKSPDESSNRINDAEEEQPEMCLALNEKEDSVLAARNPEPEEDTFTEEESLIVITEESETVDSSNEAANHDKEKQPEPEMCQVLDEKADSVSTASNPESDDESFTEDQSLIVITEDSETVNSSNEAANDEEKQPELEMCQVLDENADSDSVSISCDSEPEEGSFTEDQSLIVITGDSKTVNSSNEAANDEEKQPELEKCQVLDENADSDSVSISCDSEPEEGSFTEDQSLVIITTEDSETADSSNEADDDKEKQPVPEMSQVLDVKADSVSTPSSPEPEEESLGEPQSQVIITGDSESIDVSNEADDDKEKQPEPEMSQVLDEKADSVSTPSSPEESLAEPQSQIIISEDSSAVDTLNEAYHDKVNQLELEVCKVLDGRSDSVSTASELEHEEESFAEDQGDINNSEDSEPVSSPEPDVSEQTLELHSQATRDGEELLSQNTSEVVVIREDREKESDSENFYAKDLPAPSYEDPAFNALNLLCEAIEVSTSRQYAEKRNLFAQVSAEEKSVTLDLQPLVCATESHSLLEDSTGNTKEENILLSDCNVEVDEHFDDSENVAILEVEEPLDHVDCPSTHPITITPLKVKNPFEKTLVPEPPLAQIFIEDLNIQRETDINSDEDTSSDHANYGDEDEVEIESEVEFDDRSAKGITPEPISYNAPMWLPNVCESLVDQTLDQVQEPSGQTSDSVDNDASHNERHQSSEGPTEEPAQSLPPYFDTMSGLARRPKKIDFFGRGGNTRLSSEESLRSRKRVYPNFDQVPEPLIVSPSFSGDVTPTLIEKADHHIYPLKKRHRVLNNQSDDGESMESSTSNIPVVDESTSDFDGQMNLSTGRTRKRQATSSSEDTTPTKRSKTPPELRRGSKNHPPEHEKELQMAASEMSLQVVEPPPPEQFRPRNESHPESSGPFINLSEVFPRDEFDLSDDDLDTLGKGDCINVGIFPLGELMMARPMGASHAASTYTSLRPIRANSTTRNRKKGWQTRRHRRK